jgi:O-antigen ligase
LVSDAFHRSFKFSSLDGPSRFLFAIPIYFLLRQMPSTVPRALEFGFPLGALAGLLTSIFFPSIHWTVGTYFVDSIRFGGASLALGFLSLATINWTRKDPPAMLALKLGGFVVGLYCVLHATARGAWIAIPIVLLILAYFKFEGLRRTRNVVVMTSVFMALAGYQLVPQVRDRIAATQSEFTSILAGDFDTSIGLRLQIWNAAIKLIRDNPIAGVGPTGLPDALRAMHQSGAIDDTALDLGIAETHNEILSHTVKLGVLGLLEILAIYLVPAILFAAATYSGARIRRNAGITGMLFVATYFIFGLTVETFNIKTFATFYALTVACLLAVARRPAPRAADRADPVARA